MEFLHNVGTNKSDYNDTKCGEIQLLGPHLELVMDGIQYLPKSITPSSRSKFYMHY